ncbi:hypothetical protein [Streptomyces sp. NBC_01506]|uniref:hypothetical protein n=1 Tax=Streptomyces sp. NBC_01506 TaxID=2903887 RepID=UPI003869CC4F
MPRDIVTTAQQEAAEARATLDSLTERVKAGDPNVTASQLSTQRELIKFAELRVTAAERKQAEAQRADLDARARAVGERARALVAEDSTDDLVAAAGDVLEATMRLVAVSAARDETIREVASEGVAVNDQLKRDPNDHWPSREYGFMAQNFPPVGVTAVGLGRAESVHAGAVLGAILSAALAGQSDAQHRAGEILGLPGESTKRVLEGVPGLVAALRYDREAWDQLPEKVRNESARQGRRPVSEG